VIQGGQRSQDKEWASDFVDFGHVVEQRHRLDCFAQTHFISEHDVPVVLERT
jgi:hypothetical protein